MDPTEVPAAAGWIRSAGWALFVATAAIAAVLLFLFLSALLGANGDAVPTRAVSNAPLVASGGDATWCRDASRPNRTLRLELARIDVASGEILVKPFICVNRATLSQIVDKESGASVLEPGGRSGRIRIVNRYRNRAVKVRFVSRLPFKRHKIILQLKDFNSAEPVKKLRLRAMRFATIGSSKNYPNDSYRVVGQARVLLAGSLKNGAIADPKQSVRLLPMQRQLVRSQEVGDFEAKIDSGELSHYAIALVRPDSTRYFVWLILVVPVLLIVGLGLIGRSARDELGAGGLALGCAAIALALLPIRAVLVPTSISSLTLVDFALGAELGLLAAFAVLQGARYAGQRPFKTSTPESEVTIGDQSEPGSPSVSRTMKFARSWRPPK